MKEWIHSRVLRWTLYTGLFFLLLMTLLRLTFFIAFKQVHLSWREATGSFILGFRFDLRSACVLMMIMLLIGSIRLFNPFESAIGKKTWFWILGIVAFLFCFFYIVDFAYYSYLSQRLNASVLNYLQDAGISMNMVWQSYPVIKLILLLAVATFLILFTIKYFYKKISKTPVRSNKKSRVIAFVVAFLLFAIGIFGRIGQYPLRWSAAFSLGNESRAYLSLNPFQSFFSTLSFRSSTFDLAKTKKWYSLMVAQLGIQNPDSNTLIFTRSYPARDTFNGIKPNIVVVICESFSGYKSSMWGNPLNTTPYFNEMCRNGIFFKHCFTPTFGTARGVWATLTGIPDVEAPQTASRNMAMVNQNMIINDFKGYQKLYFIGGSASWANIRGFLMNNIQDLHLYEGDDYKSPKIDVWGISDKNLFLEANGFLKQQTKPFFAVIQTADNHRPYTIPKEDEANFKKESYPADTLNKYGFESNDELNAFRFTDYCFQRFIEAAKKENYFKNTIFIFVGDHGIRGNAGNMFPRAWTDNGLTSEHVPLLFYSPALLQPQVRTDICSQIDILPSAASLSGLAFHNYTLGRNLFNNNFTPANEIIPQCAFIIDPETRRIGIIDSNYYYSRPIASGKDLMVSVKNNMPVGNTDSIQKRKAELHNLTDAYYETAKYLLFNNKHK
ncbi:MAG: sulfatase-like hydrolase/transferase [Bacteroidetes bacterium]|nr:sulfatase-like hydrolase/transferase [Bacteroidota bacterium]MBS1929806.1 sulfatase-like hydrolase/transferase [Bacteroidota bacterium]